MKKKKLIKIIKEAIKDSYFENTVQSSPKLASNDFNYTDSTDETKQKIRNLILRLSQKRDEIEFNISEYSISIHASDRKKISNQIYFHIEVIKEVGYNISCNNRRVMIKDVTIYDEMLPKIKETFDKVNLDNFNELYSSVMIDNGLSRESNLDELLRDY